VIGNAPVATAEHQDLDELVEHDPIGGARPVTAQRVKVGMVGEQGSELDPQRVQDARWHGGHGHLIGCGGTCPDS
jgi:hypothetical protein